MTTPRPPAGPYPDGLDPDDLPAALRARPWHRRMRVPVPVMNVHHDPKRRPQTFIDFLGVDPVQAERAGRNRTCGVCGDPLGPEVAFLGTEGSVVEQVFADPPMHEPCARAALRWCPHLRLRHHRAASPQRLHADVVVPEGWEDRPKPDAWGLALSLDYGMAHLRYDVGSLDGVLVFVPGVYRRVSIFRYTGPDETLEETRK